MRVFVCVRVRVRVRVGRALCLKSSIFHQYFINSDGKMNARTRPTILYVGEVIGTLPPEF